MASGPESSDLYLNPGRYVDEETDRYNLAALAQGFAVEALLDLIADLTDKSACHYDHHGHCQTHMTAGFQECPHEVARRLLTLRAVHEGGVA